MIVTLTLNPAIDIKMVVRGPRLGTLNRAERTFVEPSGKGINVSRALAALGVRSRAVAPLGGTFGRSLRDALTGLGFDLEIVPIEGETRVNTKIIDAADGRLTEFNSPGPSLGAEEWRAVQAALEAGACAADVAVLSGSLPPGTPVSIYGEWLARLRSTGVFTVLDAEGAALSEALAVRPDVIKPNRREAGGLVGYPLRTLGDAVRAAGELRGRGAGMVALTLDRAGALLAAREATVLAVPPPLRERNSNGAGDALIAGLVAGLRDGLPLDVLARRAVAAGSARAAAASGGFADAAAVAGMEAGIHTFVLDPAGSPAWSALELDTLTADDVTPAVGATGAPARKGPQR